jgi:uncharacterized pyridoxal phosphate-containing UPF0001 family protein
VTYARAEQVTARVVSTGTPKARAEQVSLRVVSTVDESWQLRASSTLAMGLAADLTTAMRAQGEADLALELDATLELGALVAVEATLSMGMSATLQLGTELGAAACDLSLMARPLLTVQPNSASAAAFFALF